MSYSTRFWALQLDTDQLKRYHSQARSLTWHAPFSTSVVRLGLTALSQHAAHDHVDVICIGPGHVINDDVYEWSRPAFDGIVPWTLDATELGHTITSIELLKAKAKRNQWRVSTSQCALAGLRSNAGL